MFLESNKTLMNLDDRTQDIFLPALLPHQEQHLSTGYSNQIPWKQSKKILGTIQNSKVNPNAVLSEGCDFEVLAEFQVADRLKMVGDCLLEHLRVQKSEWIQIKF